MISLASRTETLLLWSRFPNYLNTFCSSILPAHHPFVLFSDVHRFGKSFSCTLAPVLRTRRYTTSVELLDQFQFLSILLVRFLLTFSHL